MNRNEIARAAQTAIDRILTESGRPTHSCRDEDLLVEQLGFDSLDLAVLIVSLQETLGVDPYRSGRSLPRSFGQVVAAYHESHSSQQ